MEIGSSSQGVAKTVKWILIQAAAAADPFPSDSPGHEEEQVGSVEATKSLA